jgi:hypothetical protein
MIKNRAKANTGRTSTDELLDEAAALNLSREQLAWLRHAASLHHGTKADRRRADEIVAKIRREIGAGVVESVALEAGRGGEVRDFNTAGAKRLADHDGLLSLYRAGRLSNDQTGAGLAYRRAMEAKGAVGCSSPLRAGGSATMEGYLKAWLTKARLGVHAAVVDRQVALELKDRPDCLDTLRRVAGYGQSVRSLAPGGKQFDRRVEALVLALDIAARHLVVDPT